MALRSAIFAEFFLAMCQGKKVQALVRLALEPFLLSALAAKIFTAIPPDNSVLLEWHFSHFWSVCEVLKTVFCFVWVLLTNIKLAEVSAQGCNLLEQSQT